MRALTRLLGLVLVVPLVSAFSQDAGTQRTTYGSPGSSALLFSFSGLANLGANAFDGGIGVKWYRSSPWALRAGLQFALASRDIPANPPPGGTGTDGSVSAWRLGAGGAAEYHLGTGRVSPFVGGGLGFSYTRTESKNAVTGGGAQTTIQNDINGETVNGQTFEGGLAISLYGMAGVEYFVSDEVSLAAEYRLGVVSTSRFDDERVSGNTTITTKSGSSLLFGISTGGALTLAVYF